MSRVLAALRLHAATRPQAAAVSDGNETLGWAELLARVERLAEHLGRLAPRVLGLIADNGIDWVVADLAALRAGIPIVPLPGFFSPGQLQHTLRSAGVDLLLAGQPHLLSSQLDMPHGWLGIGHGALHALRIEASLAAPTLPAGTRKITFTSGTTGTPKGVCLDANAMERVALSLQEASAASAADRHVCLLPLATLLENVAGVYVPILAGATCFVPSLREVGLAGSSGLDVKRQLATLDALQASTAILVPQMLAAQLAALEAGVPRPRALRFVAVGGGSVSPQMLQRAQALGLPVFEGYGLSECASVVALNQPDAQRPGSVGKPLPHVKVRIAADGEILIDEARFAGYLGQPGSAARTLATGDLGHIDEDGYLYVTGRKKSVFITAFGRNVSPEWVERELLAQPCLLQAAVFGEARAFNVAVLVPQPGSSPLEITEAVGAANAALPDYARIRSWVVARAPFTPDNGLLTHNGRPRRETIAATYADDISSLYRKQTHELLC